MSTQTTNLGLTLPAGNEYVSRAVINGNMGIIDGAVGQVPQGSTIQGQISENAEAISDLMSAVGTVPTGKTVQGQIADLENNKVPTTRKVNNKALSSDVNLVGSDIPVSELDSTKLDVAISDLKSTTLLQEETIPDTTQTISFDSSGNVSSIVHKDGSNNTIRSDAFTFGANTITEVRTLYTGETLTIVTNTTTLVTTVTYAAA